MEGGFSTYGSSRFYCYFSFSSSSSLRYLAYLNSSLRWSNESLQVIDFLLLRVPPSSVWESDPGCSTPVRTPFLSPDYTVSPSPDGVTTFWDLSTDVRVREEGRLVNRQTLKCDQLY